MALEMLKTTPEGIAVRYWVIQSIQVDRAKGEAGILLAPYVSKAAYEKGMQCVKCARVHVRVEDILYEDPSYGENAPHYTAYFSPKALHAATGDLYQVAYQYIKTHIPEFQGAVDA